MEQNSTETQLPKHIVTHRCLLVDYGEAEKRCMRCGYITWRNDAVSDDYIIEQMIKAGYPTPKCDNGG